MHAVFRFDASPAIGAGHAYRCLTFASSLQTLGWRCAFAVNSAAAETVPALRSQAFRLVSAESDLRDVWPGGVDWLVVDHYGLDARWESRWRGWTKQILAIDDLADRPHDCDLLLDQTFGRRQEDYDGLVPAECRRLIGSDYALLRPDFARARPASLARRSGASRVRRILVSLGATDPENHTSSVLHGIAESGLDVAVDVVLGGAARHLEAVRAACAALPLEVTLHVETAEMPQIMAAADLAIGAAGTSTWERCCLGLPSLLVVIADNQRDTAAVVSAAGAACLLPGPRAELPSQVAAALRALAGDSGALQRLAANAAAIGDGRGCDRLGLALTAPGRTKDGGAVALRLANPADEDIILAWQSHPTTRRFARNPAVPSAEEHRRWLSARLADPDCLLTIITLDGVATGMLRLDPLAGDEAVQARLYEVSILIDPQLRGLGIALEALRLLRRWQAVAIIAATVLPGNDASAALFRRAGYTAGADALLYSYPKGFLPRHEALSRAAQR